MRLDSTSKKPTISKINPIPIYMLFFISIYLFISSNTYEMLSIAFVVSTSKEGITKFLYYS